MDGIIVKDLEFTYPNGFKAVKGINLEIKKGERVAIIGQNGAGKTTLSKLLINLFKPSLGKIYIDNKDISKLTTAKTSKLIGYVFQNPDDQMFNNTVYEEIAFILRYNKLSEKEVDRLVKDAATLCGINKFLDTNPYDLPFSTRKFITIAAVIAMNSDYIILDEPTAGQDLNGLKQLNTIINELINRNKTVITITHDMEFVVENFDRIVVMANKMIILDDKKESVFWNEAALKKASLKQPMASQIAKHINLYENKIVDINSLISYISRSMPKKLEATYR